MSNRQRGLSGSVQVALLLPVAILVFLGLLQWALFAWASATAASAAQEAVLAVTGGQGANEAEYQARTAVDNWSMSEVDVQVTKAEDGIFATVRGQARRVLPFVDLSIEKHSVAVSERVTEP